MKQASPKTAFWAIVLLLFLLCTASSAAFAAGGVTVYNGVDYAEIYDYSYYCRRYPGIKAAYGGDPKKILAHFAKYGLRQGKTARDPVKYPAAKPGSAVYNKYLMLNYYPGTKVTSSYVKGAKGTSLWNRRVLTMLSVIGSGGGYSTGENAHAALKTAFKTEGGRTSIRMNELKPSFCSGAVYMLLLKTLSYPDFKYGITAKAWKNLRPYTVKGMTVPVQTDGTGAWGMANANGPGLAVLIKTLGAGTSSIIYHRSGYKSAKSYWAAWDKAVPGDILKIFRTSKIGKSEKGHLVIYLGRQVSMKNGVRDDLIYYWSSQQSTSGKGITSCRASEIYRGILTKITKPAAFNNASKLSPKKTDAWLHALLREKDVTVSEVKRKIG